MTQIAYILLTGQLQIYIINEVAIDLLSILVLRIRRHR